MLNESKIMYFLSLTETLSFSQTALYFGVSQQAVSKSIAALERDLGVSLFTRSRSHVLLTEAGSEWRGLFQTWYRQLQETRERISRQCVSQRASLRLGYQDYMSMGDLTGSLLTGLRRANPSADIQIESHSPLGLWAHLVDRRLDAILVCRRFIPETRGFRFLSLFQIPLVVLVSATHPRLRADSTYRDFISDPLVVDRMEQESPGDCTGRAWQDCVRYGLTPSRIVTVPNRDSAYTAVEMGQGFLLATANSRARSRVALKSFPANAVDTLVCIWREEDANPLLAALTNVLAAYFQIEPAEGTDP